MTRFAYGLLRLRLAHNRKRDSPVGSVNSAVGVVGWFLLKAAIEFDPSAPVGIGGALSKLAHATYGLWVLSITAARLIAFAVFDLFQARFHRA